MKIIDADAFEKYAWGNPDIEVDGEPYISPSTVQNFAADHPITIDPPNEPLTLEQLREMDGHPVWVVERPDWGHWELSADAEDYIAERDQDFYGLKHNDPAGRYGLHMLGWLAYRRPPEEEDKHGDYHPVMNR